jgi:hypothetical protein
MQFLHALGVAFRVEITEAMAQLYIAALLPVEPDVLQLAVIHGVREWRFFPTIAEIMETVRQHQAKRSEAAYERMVARYVEAHRAGTLPKYPFKSVLDSDLKQLGDGRELTRQELLALGIAQAKPLTAEEHERRIAELRAQHEHLKQTEGERS